MISHPAAHRSGHLGDYVVVTPHEYRELQRLRVITAALLVKCDESEWAKSKLDEDWGEVSGEPLNSPPASLETSLVRRLLGVKA